MYQSIIPMEILYANVSSIYTLKRVNKKCGTDEVSQLK